MKQIVKKILAIFLICIMIFNVHTQNVEAKAKYYYSTETKVTMTGKLRKIKYYAWNGTCNVNYVLYLKKKFYVDFSYCDDTSVQKRICVQISKKQWKKYKNKKVKIIGTLGETSTYYCTNFCIYNVKKIKRIFS